MLRALLYETLMLLNRLYSNSNALPPDTNARSKSIYVDRFIELVNHSFKQDHSIRSYADRLCITPNYLNEIVKNATGINAKQYILNKILIESKRLLTYTDLPISAITEALGYEDPSYFIRLFRSQTNMTPLTIAGIQTVKVLFPPLYVLYELHSVCLILPLSINKAS